MFNFAEVVTGSPKKRPGTIRPVVDFPDNYGGPAVEMYCSAYRFCDEFKAPRGYKGPCRATGVHFDFDGFDDLALRELRQFAERLTMRADLELTIESIRLFFSGGKGFHAHITSPEISGMPAGADVPEKIKKIAGALAAGCATWDPSVYDTTRIFRVPNSRHPKTGLFKIPLFAGELWTLTFNEIRTLARRQRKLTDPATIRAYMGRHYVTT